MIVSRATVSPFDFDGLRIFDYTAGTNSSSSFALIEVPTGAVHAESWSQRSDKYYFILAGSLRFVLDNEVHDLQAADFCLVKVGQHFSYSNEAAETARLVLIHTPSFEPAHERFVESSPRQP